MDSKKVILGLCAGVAVGAVLGILFAPDKGSETRRKIAKKGNDYKQNARDKFGNLAETASEKIAAVKSKFNEYTGKAEDKIQAAADKAQAKA